MLHAHRRLGQAPVARRGALLPIIDVFILFWAPLAALPAIVASQAAWPAMLPPEVADGRWPSRGADSAR